MLTQPLYKILLPWLPEEYHKSMEELEHRANVSSKKAIDLVLQNPAVTGITKTELLDWIPAMISVTFKQHFEDRKLDTSTDDEQLLSGLCDYADETIANFISKYKNEQYDAMRPTNFINEFVAIFTRRLSNVCPDALSLCFEQNSTSDVEVIKTIFESDDWLTIKDFKPQFFAKLLETTEKASNWARRGDEVNIIPIEVVQDVLIFSSLFEQFMEATNDYYNAIDEELPKEIIKERRSISDEIYADILNRLSKYETEPNEVESWPLTFAADRIAARFTKDPKNMIAMFGPNILCVPWSDDIT